MRFLPASLLWPLVLAVSYGAAAAETPSLIREEQTVIVNGVKETWSLQWDSAPKPFCVPLTDEAATCPCNSFAYGEVAAEASLVRLRDNREIERLPLSKLFAEVDQGLGAQVALQHWPFEIKDIDAFYDKTLNKEKFLAGVYRRPTVKLMQFADYDHDGKAVEFFLDLGTSPCGHHWGVVIGLSPGNPHLHAFTLARHPDKPLVLQNCEWEALRDMKGNKTTVVDWQCGDHGSETITELELSLHHSKMGVVSRNYACTKDDKRGKLISKEAW